MPIKNIFLKICSGHKAQATFEFMAGALALIAIISATIGQGWSMAFSTYKGYEAERLAFSKSYEYANGAFGPGKEAIAALFNPDENDKKGVDRYSGSPSRNVANVIIRRDNLSPVTWGQYGDTTRTQYMLQGGPASYTGSLFMPMNKPLDRFLPVIDVYDNYNHFPFRVAGFRKVDLYKPGSPFWDRHCMTASNPRFEVILDENGNTTSAVMAILASMQNKEALYDVNGEVVFDQDGNYEGPSVDDAGEPLPRPLKAFVVIDWMQAYGKFRMRLLPSNKYPDAPDVGCMAVYAREFNQANGAKWCDGIGKFDGCGTECCHMCDEARFDYDLSSQMFYGESPECLPTSDVPADLRPKMFWQWYRGCAVEDLRGDGEGGDPKVKSTVKLHNCIPIQEHDYYDFPAPHGPGEKSLVGDRDYVEEQLITITKTDKYFGNIEEATVLDTNSGDLDYNSNDNEEIGFYFGEDLDADGNITVQSPVKMFSKLKDGTYMEVEDTDSQVITTRSRDMVTLVETQIKVSEGATIERWCNFDGVDGEPNPVQACGNCQSDANKTVTCFDPSARIIYSRTIISNKSNFKWIVEKFN